MDSKNTREEWLTVALNLVADHIRSLSDVEVPRTTKVSCGFPGGRAGRTAIGQCWSDTCSAEGMTEIFISPVVSDGSRVLDILVHEAVHAAVGVQHGHKAPFKKVALAVGLEGKMKATVAGTALKETIAGWLAVLGAYPHAALTPSMVKKQSTRLVKCECPECGYTVRTTAKWLAVGTPLCPACTDEDDLPLAMRASIQGEGEE